MIYFTNQKNSLENWGAGSGGTGKARCDFSSAEEWKSIKTDQADKKVRELRKMT